MKILFKDFKKGEVKILIDSRDDLWYLTQIIDLNDTILGSTERKIKIGDSNTDRNVKVIRKKIFLGLKVEKIELNENLRILGTITSGPDDISFGSYHSFDIQENDVLTIIKTKWLKFQITKLNDATKVEKSKILIVAFDREEAYFAELGGTGLKHLTNISGNVQKKDMNNEIKSNFYTYLLETIENYDKKQEYNKIICASPAFWKEEFAKILNNSKITKKILYSTISSVDKRAFNEILKRSEIVQALKEVRMTKELGAVDKLLTEISKEGLAAYGFKEVKSALDLGAISHLLVTNSLITSLRDKNDFEKLDKLMKMADDMGSDITLIDKDNDAGKKLDGLGGIGAILRFKLQ